LVVAGDFGRTLRISYAESTGSGVAGAAAGVVQPAREHWPHATSFLFSGGGIAEGQVLGATDGRGEHPVSRRVGVGDFLATIYRRLGIDAERASVRDPAGRPVPLLQQDGAPIRELMANRRLLESRNKKGTKRNAKLLRQGGGQCRHRHDRFVHRRN
jgi:hypothetical protein